MQIHGCMLVVFVRSARTSALKITARTVDGGSARDLGDTAGPLAKDAQFTGLVAAADSPNDCQS